MVYTNTGMISPCNSQLLEIYGWKGAPQWNSITSYVTLFCLYSDYWTLFRLFIPCSNTKWLPKTISATLFVVYANERLQKITVFWRLGFLSQFFTSLHSTSKLCQNYINYYYIWKLFLHFDIILFFRYWIILNLIEKSWNISQMLK